MDKNKKTEHTKDGEIHLDGRLALAVLMTFVMLIGCLVPMFVGLAMDMNVEEPVVEINGGTKPNKGNDTVKPSVPTVGSLDGKKTGIALPSATGAGTFLCASDANTSEITDTSIKSAAIALIDITDGRAVALKNADAKIYPASMTKIMTLLVACENAKDPNALLTVTQDMADKYAREENKGASVAFNWQVGYQVSVEDALYLIIYESDTYACWLLADYVADSEEAFVQMMNNKASELGLTATNFTNCTGVYNDNHYTTCREMAAIMAATMNNETATAVATSTEKYSVDIYENGKKTDNVKAMYAAWYSGRLEEYRWGQAAPYYAGNGSDIKIIGGKTGYETIPSCCFVTAAIDTETNRKYVCVQVGRTEKAQESVSAKVSTDDTRLVYQKYAVE